MCSTFTEFAAEYFDSHSVPSVSWKFFLQQKNYRKALTGLEEYSRMTLTSSQRNEIYSWFMLVSGALEESENNHDD